MHNHKFHISYLLFPLMLTACGGHDDALTDEPASQLVPIAIGSAQEADMQEATRAGLPLEEVLGGSAAEKNFRVWCYKTMSTDGTSYTQPQTVMDRYIVQWKDNTAGTTSSNTADWEYAGIQNNDLNATQEIKYWDMSATSYRFFGFAPGNRLASETNYTYPASHGDGFVWFDITFPANATTPEESPYISMMWFSNNSQANHTYGDGVTMEFMKPVCKVRIKLLRMDGTLIENPAEEGFSQLEFQPTGGAPIVRAGNLKVSYAITGPATSAYYTPSVQVEGDPTGTVQIDKLTSGYDDYYLVLPHVTQGSYQLVAKIGIDTKIATVPEQYMSWQPNIAYTYVFKLTEDAFRFIDIVQVAVTEWRTHDEPHDVYNW